VVNDPKNDELIRWSEQGDSFVVLDEDEFEKNLIPELFKHNNYSSFVRQLNMYGFHKRVDPSDNSMKASERKNKSPSEYYNPHFKRGHPNLLRLIKRKEQRKRNNPALHGIDYASSQEHVVPQIPAFAQHLETHPSSSSTGSSSRRALRKNASASVVAMVRLQARQMQEVNTKDQLAVDMPPLTSEQQAELSSERNASSSITNYAIGVVQSHGALVPTSVGISNSTGVETFGCEPSKDPTSTYVDLRRNSNTPVSTGKTNFYTLDTDAQRKEMTHGKLSLTIALVLVLVLLPVLILIRKWVSC
ncbi:hypothetical protein V500_04586, partial [Pseudogymnoascus sp. VKM F-4518 (FW-2643)]